MERTAIPTLSAREAFDSDESPRSPIACDVHTHTLFSRHAYSTIAENVAQARRVGLELLGITDHYSAMISALTPENPDCVRDFQHFINMRVLPRVWDGVRVLRGAEADIVDLSGHLFGWDLRCERGITGKPYANPPTLLELIERRLDYLIASIHDSTFTKGATIAETTDMYVGALSHPKVLIVGHAGRAGVPFDLDTVLLCAKERGKLIEINEHSFVDHYLEERRMRCREIAERCAELGVMICCSTDAHVACDVGRFDTVWSLLEEIHFPPELNASRSAQAFLDVLGRALP